MSDREKVINGLTCCINHNECKKCPYANEYDTTFDCIDRTRKDALELIESQEKIIKNLLMQIEDIGKPTLVDTDEENYAHLPVTKCPRCKRPIRMYYDPCHTFLTKACPYCGKVVTWE